MNNLSLALPKITDLDRVALTCGFTYPEFRAAAEEAKSLAIRFHESVRVQRTGDSWHLVLSDRIIALIEAGTKRELAMMNAEIDAEYDESGEEWDDDPSRREVDELVAEQLDDADDYARSQEEGWMYPD